ncbi:MAG: ATP-binding protein [Dehalococcoidia bacterium]
MAQLFENLLSNAVKFSPAGSAITRGAGWETAVLSVRDHGIGIATADLPHIFERFQRGANVDDRRFAGMGLGLFLCRGIVEQHGGRIEACSRPGAGSVFHITLPLDGEVGRDG